MHRRPYSKRRRIEEPDDPLTSLLKRIVSIGEAKPAHSIDLQAHQDASFIVNILISNESLIPQVTISLLEAIRGFPWKCPVYARLTHFISTLHHPGPLFTATLLETLHSQIQYSLDGRVPGVAALPSLLRFAACLSTESLIQYDDIILVYSKLSSFVLDPSQPASRRGSLLESILVSLPWVLPALFSSRDQDHLKDHLTTITSIFLPSEQSPVISDLVDVLMAETEILSPFTSDSSSLVSLLLAHLPSLFIDWDDQDSTPPQPFYLFTLPPTQTEKPRSDDQVAFTLVEIPCVLSVGESVPSCFFTFKLEDEIDASFLYISQLLTESCLAWEEQPSKFLSGIRDLLLLIGSSVEPSSYYRMVIQVCFTGLLSLKHPFQLHSLHYFFVLSGLCRSTPRFAPCLGPLMAGLIKEASSLKAFSFIRFCNWFAHHLSNFAWKWPWNAFDELLDQPECVPAKLVIGYILNKCVELSYRDRLAQELPSDWLFVLPADIPQFSELGKNPISEGFDNPCATSNYVYFDIYSQVFNKITTQDSPEDVLKLTSDLDLKERIKVNFYALLNAGIPSISFSGAYNTFYGTAFKELINTDIEQELVVSIVVSFWKVRPQRCIITLNHLQKLGIISLKSILSYCFPNSLSEESEKSCTRPLLFPSSMSMCILMIELYESLDLLFSTEDNPDREGGPFDVLACSLNVAMEACDKVADNSEETGDSILDLARQCNQAGGLEWFRLFTLARFGELVSKHCGERKDIIVAESGVSDTMDFVLR
ncbi:hypothetical protein P9112_002426 [Eukaryota sp. TZLM1-RC]